MSATHWAFRGLLRPEPPSCASLSYTSLNRHAADTRIGLVDSTVPVDTILSMQEG